MAAREYREGAHTVYDIKVHLVWVTKYRHKVLRGEVGTRTRDLIRQVCAARELKILKGHVGVDHVHLLVSMPPSLSVSQMMQYLKGKSSRVMLQEFAELRRRYWGQHLWARGYFCASSGTVTDEMIKAYIDQQDVPPDDGFRVADEKL
jgi:REP-associated tyrosine transposase